MKKSIHNYITEIILKQILMVFAIAVLVQSCSEEQEFQGIPGIMGHPEDSFLYESYGRYFWGFNIHWDEIITYRSYNGNLKKILTHYNMVHENMYGWKNHPEQEYRADFEYRYSNHESYYVYRNGKRIKNITVATPYKTTFPDQEIDYFNLEVVYTPTKEAITIYKFYDRSLDNEEPNQLQNIVIWMNKKGDLLDLRTINAEIIYSDSIKITPRHSEKNYVDLKESTLPLIKTSDGIEQVLCIGNISGKYPRLPIVYVDDMEIVSSELLHIYLGGTDYDSFISSIYRNYTFINPRYDELIKEIDEGLEWLE